MVTRALEVDDRQLVSSGSPWEKRVGFSRAVRVGNGVLVAGTACALPGNQDPPADAYSQAKWCLDTIEAALNSAGARIEDTVRTRIYLVDTADFEAVGRAHGEVFGEIRPANSTVTVKELLDPRWRVEIEAEAIIGSHEPRRDR